MEDELRCPTCKQLFANPVLLPCYHAICLACALESQVPSATTISNTNPISGGSNSVGPISGGNTIITSAQVHAPHNHHQHHQHHQSTSSSVSTGSSSAAESVSSDQDQADKVSILSEADSGVVCCTSRPGSYAGTPNLQGLLFPPSGGIVLSLACPLCRKIVFFDETGARNLPSYRIMESIIDRFCEREALRCQMCESEPPKVATVVCEQCEIRYCDGCRELCHPARGPLAKHNLTKPRGPLHLRESQCSEHNELLTMYCLTCKIPTCQLCFNENRHNSHDVQQISSMCKSQKVSRFLF